MLVATSFPQGSILGPLHFIIYVNDITNSNNLFKLIIYTDDTSFPQQQMSFLTI